MRHPVGLASAAAGHPGAPGRGLCHWEAGMPVCRLHGPCHPAGTMPSPETGMASHAWEGAAWGRKRVPDTSHGAELPIQCHGDDTGVPASVPPPDPTRLVGHRPPPQRKRPLPKKQGFLSPQQPPLPAFQPFSHPVSLFTLPPCSSPGTTRLSRTTVPPAPCLAPRLCLSLSPPSIQHHRPSCTLPRPAPLSVSLTPVHPAPPSVLHAASPRTSVCLSLTPVHPAPSSILHAASPRISVCLSLTPVHPTPPSVLHAASPRASPWSSLLPGARLLMPCAPLLRSLRGPPCLVRPPQEPPSPDPLPHSSTPQPPSSAGGGEGAQVSGGADGQASRGRRNTS